jgi:catechol 2,3-dioxygenase-like lactoylglutathione lyase family enzyme
MKILFIASVAIVTADAAQARQLFVDALGLPLEQSPGDEYASSEHIEGTKHFGVWPLAQAAQACFGKPEWPADQPVPQVSVEFELESPAAVEDGIQELAGRGYAPLHGAHTEPWGQTVARMLSADGAIIGLSYTPPLHAGR